MLFNIKYAHNPYLSSNSFKYLSFPKTAESKNL